MNKTQRITLLTIFFGIFLNGCQLQVTPPKRVTCPVREQTCIQKRWEGIPFDTSLAYREVSKEYYVLQTVKQINSPEDEWTLSFVNDKKAVLTLSDADQNRVMMVNMPRENRGTLETGLGIPIEGNIGAFTIRNNKVVFAATTNEPILGNSDLYTADLEGNILTNVKHIGDTVHQNVLTWESHPALSPDGSVIFFSSNRILGTGELDLWFTVKLPDGSWCIPISCGDSVNSSCDELTPFVTVDGKKLLFSSSGHETVGGYDIFVSKISDEFWKMVKFGNIEALRKGNNFFTNAENMRAPLNTIADELFPSSPSNTEELLYFSSNQAEKTSSILSRSGGFDIYLRKLIKKAVTTKDTIRKIADNFEYTIEDMDLSTKNSFNLNLNPNPNANPNINLNPNFLKYTLTGMIYNARTGMPATNADVIVREIRTKPPLPTYVERILKDTTGKYKIVELEKDREFEVTAQSKDVSFETFKLRKENNDTLIVVTTNKNGVYSVDLEKDREFEVTAQAPDLFFESFKLRVDKSDSTTTITKFFYIPEQFVLRVNFPSGKYNDPYKFVLDSNGVETSQTWQEEMNLLAQNLLLSQNKIKKIILIGHTDDVGSIEINNKLGFNRVTFVKNELVKRGISEGMLELKSAGELSPLPLRTGERKDNELFRKRLRRVELQKVLND